LSVSISIVIPVLNEEANIERAIARSNQIADEVIVVDGGSTDRTLDILSKVDCVVLHGPAGRGQQLHAGAIHASGEILLFLHADTSLQPSAKSQLQEAWSLVRNDPNGEPSNSTKSHGNFWGCFKQRIDSPRYVFRLIEQGNLWRARFQRLPYGDQAVFVSRDFYEQVGGIPQIPLMEDLEFARRAAKFAAPSILPGPVLVDARRWEHVGPVRQTIRNWTLAMRYRMGASPESLLAKY